MKNSLLPANILLPKENFKEWSVIACDQYTSEPEYWHNTEKAVGNKPSALNIIFPEVYLNQDKAQKIADINSNMLSYLNSGVFNLYENTLVLVDRTLKSGKTRKGIVGLIDLEDYSYEKGSKTLIRATEETVAERIPTRVEIRKDAPLEIPHIMLLIDDPQKTVIEPLENTNGKTLYDFDLMQNGGHIKGTALGEKEIASVNAALNRLTEKGEDKLLFAVGDGNHSLATAKECYRINPNPLNRYALVEVVNIHDTSLEFEPIYRVLFGVEPKKTINAFLEYAGGEYDGADKQTFTLIYGNTEMQLSVRPKFKLSVGTLQAFIDDYIKQNKNVTVDYIHGISSTKSISSKPDALGFIFNGMEKSELFPAVMADGSLPRKTFSMGEADDKRFYLEARRII